MVALTRAVSITAPRQQQAPISVSSTPITHGIAYEIESWNTSGTSTVWVRAAEYAASSTDFIYMSTATRRRPDAQDKNSVWSNGYKMVHHFKEASGTYTDQPRMA